MLLKDALSNMISFAIKLRPFIEYEKNLHGKFYHEDLNSAIYYKKFLIVEVEYSSKFFCANFYKIFSRRVYNDLIDKVG